MQKASVNMTARVSVKTSHIEDDLMLVLKKLTPTVKVITLRLRLFVVSKCQVQDLGDIKSMSMEMQEQLTFR